MIEVVVMNESHLAEAIEIERECFSDPWSEKMLGDALEAAGCLYIAAVDTADNGKLIGYAGMAQVLDEGHIHNVAVAPACRKMGVGRMLISELLFCAREAGIKSILLEVRPGNEAAVALYGGFGFEVVGRRKHYYQNPVEDALLMTLLLG